MVTVTLKQVTNTRWDLLAPKGTVILGDIYLYSRLEAEEWVRNYISSYPCWKYEIVVL